MDDRWYAGDRMISTLNNSFLTIQGRGDGTVSDRRRRRWSRTVSQSLLLTMKGRKEGRVTDPIR